MPSETKPSTDQVLTNTLIGFGLLERWVSRSALWVPLTVSFWGSQPQPSRLFGSSNGVLESRAMSSSACLTNQDTMPGLAPQVETAVVPPGLLCLAASRGSAQAEFQAFSGPVFFSKEKPCHGSITGSSQEAP